MTHHQPSDGQPPQGSHHFVITLETPISARSAGASYTLSGTLTPPPGATRYDVYQLVRAEAERADPLLQRANTVFFSLERNEL
ncbi:MULTISPECIES: hypothetical protein [Streptomyces]|uniref:hypothetical protein n=1 Tax=Streptomyces TaxID=1883 RepID=UPI00163BA584|nr:MULTISPECIES: hypothetical protein [Streptomyces]MBC2879806.1 hypothetical protein [Streptomyces sp. TYQ1024]UBI41412.1 hypothetical protein K7I03_33650 [Streptomyces mobaraensis]